MGVAFKELAGSPVETYCTTGIKTQRHLLCAWEDRFALLNQLLGSGTADDPSQSAYPGQSTVLAVQVGIQPFEGRPDDQGQFDTVGTQVNSYSGQFAELTVDYQLATKSSLPPLPSAAAGTFFTYQLQSASQLVPVTSAAAVAAATAGTEAAAMTVLPMVIRVPVIERCLTWHRVMQPAWDLIRASFGTVNDAPFLGADPATLLFDGIKADPEFVGCDPGGQALFGWQIAFRFQERSQASVDSGLGWLPTGQGTSSSASDEPTYQAVDFAALFLPAAASA